MPTIQPLTGGLGNQLFQYAHGLKLSLIDKKDVIFDTSFFTNTGKDIHRPFLLDKFNIQTTARFVDVPKTKLSVYLKKILSRITGNYGLYQSEKYFIDIKEEILKQFTLKQPLSPAALAMANVISAEANSVLIQIRRGDYVQNPKTLKHHGVCSLEYYYQAIAYVREYISNPVFFVVSDDIEWVKENLKIDNPIYVSNPNIKDYEEIILMSLCAHDIIANSTFSWWGAYLNTNPNKIVIAPKQWTVKKNSDQLDILPKGWIQI